ncbi:MAG: hypothetical protein ACNS64_06095 [Candidatus Halalkalibacterium sp. M3_1C_030]
MHILLLLLLTLSPVYLYSQSSRSSEPDSLHNATTVRPADPILNTAGWTFSSIDMYTYNFSNGLYGNYGIKPTIMLDGIPVDINFFGWQSLNMLPFYMPRLEQVSAESNPSHNTYSFHPGGIIDFQNKPIEPGMSAGGNIFLGNETGDPGPWIYDSSKVTPNVDRWGPDAGGIISVAKNNWHGKGIFMLRRHQQTDPRTHRRLHRTMRSLGGTRFYPIQTNSQSGLLETGYTTSKLSFLARGMAAEDRNYIYLQPLGREVPAEARYGQLAFDAKYKSDSWNFGLHYIVNQKKLNRRNSDHDYVFDWSQLSNRFKGTASYNFDKITLSGGISYDHFTTKAPGILRETDPISGFLLQVENPVHKDFGYQFSTGLDIHRKRAAKSLKAAFLHKPDNDWSMQLDISYSEVLPLLQKSFGYWITRGYNFYRELDLEIDDSFSVDSNRLLQLRLSNKVKLTDHITFSFIPELVRHYTLNIPWQMTRFDTETGSSPGTFTISQESGTRFSLQATVNYQTLKWLQQEISIDLQSTIQGSKRYEDYFLQVPAAEARYQLLINPFKDLHLTLQGYYRSFTRWLEFEALDGQEYRDINNLFPVFTGTYNSTVPSYVNIEVGAQKWFWNKRLSLQFTVQNLLNDEVQLHPIGADKSLLFNIKATAGF